MTIFPEICSELLGDKSDVVSQDSLNDRVMTENLKAIETLAKQMKARVFEWSMLKKTFIRTVFYFPFLTMLIIITWKIVINIAKNGK